jgi:hypothetical protein
LFANVLQKCCQTGAQYTVGIKTIGSHFKEYLR